MKTGIIYKHTNKINGKSYIGQTVQTMEQRLKQHLKNKKNHNFINAINKYGIDEFHSEIIEEVDENKLDEKEIYWIAYCNTYNNGYNMTEGGDGFTSTQRKKYISENYGKHIENMKKYGLLDMKGEKNPFYGKKHSEENMKKSVNNRKNNNNGEYHPSGNRTAKNFIFISPDGKEYKVFNSAKKFCEEQGINVKIFQKYPNQIIKESKMWNSRTSQEVKNSVGWKRLEI